MPKTKTPVRIKDKIQLQTNLSDIEAFALMTRVVYDSQPLSITKGKKLFAAARINGKRKRASKNDDTHTAGALETYGLIEIDASDRMTVTKLGRTIAELYPTWGALSEKKKIQLGLEIFFAWHVHKKGWDVHPGRMMFNLLEDEDLGGYLSEHDLAEMLVCAGVRKDEDYEKAKKCILDFRAKGGKQLSEHTKRCKTWIFLPALVNKWKILDRKSQKDVRGKVPGIPTTSLYRTVSKFALTDFAKAALTTLGLKMSSSPDVPSVDANSVERMFVDWLQGQPSNKGGGTITEKGAKHYSSMLRSSMDDPVFVEIPVKNIFEVVDLLQYSNLREEIEGISGFAGYNNSHGNGYLSKSLEYYSMFLDANPGLAIQKIVWEMQEMIPSAGLSYDSKLVRRYVSALLAKPFVILTGLSGSGKTKLAEAFARWLCGKPGAVENWKLVSVGADWTNSEKLLGYPDALHEGKYIMPDTGVLQFLMKAKEDEGRGVPYFLILDEMNLSHVERYFADFLSAMESVDRVVRLHDEDKIAKSPAEGGSGVAKMLVLPRNLFVIGTMNVDETTYMFSPKVLDRAQVIEFRVDKDEMLEYLDATGKLDLDKLCDANGKGLGASYATAFVNAVEKDYPAVAEAKDALAQFFPHLAKLGAEFGFRTASEFRRFAAIYVAAGGTPNDAVDFAIMQKLLPKLHGSKRKLSGPLKTLWNLCQKDPEKPSEMPSVEKEDEFDFGNECRYEISARKILRMVRALDVGFASFAEA